MRIILALLVCFVAGEAPAAWHSVLQVSVGGGGGTNFLLSNAGSALLVNTGVKFLVQ